MPLKSKGKFEKAKALQDKEEESEEFSKEEDETSLFSRRVNHLWKKRQTKFRGHGRTCGHAKLNSGQKKSGVDKEVTCFECKQHGNS